MALGSDNRINMININEVTATLAQGTSIAHIERAECLIRLSLYMRMSQAPDDWEAASLGAVLSYLSSKYGDVTLGSLPIDVQNLLLNRYSVRTIHFAANAIAGQIWDAGLETYPDRSSMLMVVEAIDFMLWYKPRVPRLKHQPNLRNAYEVLSSSKFYGVWPSIARSTFKQYWTAHVDAAPFLYVDYFEFDASFVLDPTEKDFAINIDKLLNDETMIFNFLRKSKWVYDQLESLLDYRSPLSPCPVPDWVEPLRPKDRISPNGLEDFIIFRRRRRTRDP